MTLKLWAWTLQLSLWIHCCGCSNNVKAVPRPQLSWESVKILDEHTYELGLKSSQPLGLKLGSSLKVVGFERGNAEVEQAEASRVIRAGDALVNINGHDVSKSPLKHIARILGETAYVILRFRTVESQNVNDRVAQAQQNCSGQVDVLVNKRWKSFPICAEQNFATTDFKCEALRLVEANPPNLCSLQDVNSTLAPTDDHNILVARRGGCSFHAKAAAAQQQAAKGLLIVNTDDVLFEMDTDDLFGSTVVNFPVAMISRSHGHELLDALDKGSNVYAKFILSDRCLSIAGSNALRSGVTDASEIDPQSSVLRERGWVPSGHLHVQSTADVIDFISAPFGGHLNLDVRYVVSYLASPRQGKACLLSKSETVSLLDGDVLRILDDMAQVYKCECVLFQATLAELQEATLAKLPTYVNIPVLLISERGFELLAQSLSNAKSTQAFVKADTSVLARWTELEHLQSKLSEIRSLSQQQRFKLSTRLRKVYKASPCQLHFLNKLLM